MKEERMQDKDNEKRWHEQKFYIDSGHWTSHPLFASRERHWLKNHITKIRFYGYLYRYMMEKDYKNNAKILLAPVGNGDDFSYLQGMYSSVYGIDISDIALSHCPINIIKKEGDILKSGYEDESFDIIICSLFLHHVHKTEYASFLREFFRLLRNRGTLAILEPTSMYPLGLIMSFLNKKIGNITGKVESERPVFPTNIMRIIKDTGFKNIKMRGISFNHVRFPVALQLFINMIDSPIRYYWPFFLFSESIGWFCEKHAT
ncbi:MAG: class I SAM-dependent methyltransferase [Nitrospirae bacterium]|nr:class I SAM-dependent methyltransferase [Nitrospirota bacterium]